MKTKLGPHCLRGTADAIRMIQAGARVIKCVDDFGPAADAKRFDAGVLTIGRVFTTYDPMADWAVGRNPAEAAVAFLASQQAKIDANRHMDAWEGPNEPVCDTLAKMAWYGIFEATRAWKLAEQGRKAVIGNFSVGQPRLDIDVWLEFYPALRMVLERGGYLGLHEYSWPVMQWMFGRNQVDPSQPSPLDEGWVTCRYRKVYRRYLTPDGLAVPLLITECGIDGGVNPKPFSAGAGAFREEALRRAWRDHYAVDDADSFYADQLLWYDNELKKDSYVAGATVFTVGSFGSPWDNFDIAGTRVIEHLGAAWVSMPDEPPPPSGDGDTGTGGQGDGEMPNDTTNLLSNPSFEGGYYHWHDVPELAIPNGWDFWYAPENMPRLPRQDDNFFPPETVVWNKADASPEDAAKFFLDGNFILKVFKGWGPIWWRLDQKVMGLKVGNVYRFSAPIHPDLVKRYESGNKVYADDPLAGEHRLNIFMPPTNPLGSQTKSTDWVTGGVMRFGEWTTLGLEFTATAPEATFEIEGRGRWGLINNGWFVDSPKLVLVATAPEPPGDTTPPEPPPSTGDGVVSVKDLLEKALGELGGLETQAAKARDEVAGLDAQVVKARASVRAALDQMIG